MAKDALKKLFLAVTYPLRKRRALKLAYNLKNKYSLPESIVVRPGVPQLRITWDTIVMPKPVRRASPHAVVLHMSFDKFAEAVVGEGFDRLWYEYNGDGFHPGSMDDVFFVEVGSLLISSVYGDQYWDSPFYRDIICPSINAPSVKKPDDPWEPFAFKLFLPKR